MSITNMDNYIEGLKQQDKFYREDIKYKAKERTFIIMLIDQI